MNNIAITIGSMSIYWSAVIIALGVLACFALTCALYLSHGGKIDAMFLLLTAGIILSVIFSRFMHWYCHEEQYAGLKAALTDYSIGGYCLPGVLLGTLLAALLCGLLGFTGNVRRLLDCIAPGAALGIALIRLSALFNSSCRSKIVITNPAFQRLPLGSAITSGSEVEYRFATFFVQFLLMLVLCVCLLHFFYKHRRRRMKADMPRDGHVALMFLSWYSAIEVIMDSTRYDSSFVHSNGFVSLVQIIGGVCILFVLVVYSVRSVKANGLRAYHWAMWVGWLLSFGCVGVAEYLVQRHGNWYLSCYFLMAIGCFMMAFITVLARRTVCAKKRRRRREPVYED